MNEARTRGHGLDPGPARFPGLHRGDAGHPRDPRPDGPDRFRGAAGQAPPRLPAAVDLRAWASPVEDQGALGSCTAQAGAGVIEYYERKVVRTSCRGLAALPL